MSFIAVTYGYNQFSIFNIKTSTQTLIDNIKSVCLSQIVSALNGRDSSLQKEIDASLTEEENIKKLIKTTEQDLKVEEDKEMEEKKKQEEQEKKEAKNNKTQRKGKAPPPKKAKKVENETENKVILGIKEQLSKLQNDLQNLSNNRTINTNKKKKLNELLPIFKKKYKNRVNMKIDLVDSKGDKVNISTKADLYSNEYLVEKTVYELNWFNEENPDNIVMEPLKFDGYCMRSIDEDAKYEELDKTNTKGKKPGAKKK